MSTTQTQIPTKRTARVPFGSSFWALLAAAILSGVGDSLRTLAVDVWLFTASDRPDLIRLFAVLASVVPGIAFGIWAGLASDRMSARRILITADLIRFALSLLMALAISSGLIWGIVALRFAAASASVFFASSAFVIVARIVRRPVLANANSILEVAAWSTASIGPLAGSFIYQHFGAVPALIVDAASFLVSATLIAFVKELPPDEAATPPAIDAQAPAAGDGRSTAVSVGRATQHIIGNRPLLIVLATSYTVVASATAMSFGLIFLVSQELHRAPTDLGFLISWNAVISIGAALLAPLLVRRMGLPTVYGMSLLGFGVADIVIGVAPNLAVAMVGVAVSALVNAPYNVSVVTLVQRLTDKRFLGTVDGVDVCIDGLCALLTIAAAYLTIHLAGPRPLFVACGVLCIAAAAGALAVRHRASEALDA